MKKGNFWSRPPMATGGAGARRPASKFNTGKVRVGAIVILSAIGFAFFAAYFRAMPSAAPTTPTWGKVLIEILVHIVPGGSRSPSAVARFIKGICPGRFAGTQWLMSMILLQNSDLGSPHHQ